MGSIKDLSRHSGAYRPGFFEHRCDADGIFRSLAISAPGRKRNPAISKRVGYQAPFADCERHPDRVTIPLPPSTHFGTHCWETQHALRSAKRKCRRARCSFRN